jgi:hypothetical protein
VDALIQGGSEALGEVLAADAQWYGVEDRQLCEGLKAIIDVMSRNLAGACEAESRRGELGICSTIGASPNAADIL